MEVGLYFMPPLHASDAEKLNVSYLQRNVILLQPVLGFRCPLSPFFRSMLWKWQRALCNCHLSDDEQELLLALVFAP